MYLANMASGSQSQPRLSGLSLDAMLGLPPLFSFTAFPALDSRDAPFRLSFDPAPAQAVAPPAWPNAVPGTAEPKDGVRPAAEMAALLLYLRAGEVGFLPLPDEGAAHARDQPLPPAKGAPRPVEWEAAMALQAAFELLLSEAGPVPPLPGTAVSWVDPGWGGFHAAVPPDPVWPML